MLTASQKTFLQQITGAAILAERATGYPAEATVAQAVLESGWGSKACGLYNYFGMTWLTAQDRPVAWCVTTEILSQEGINMLDPSERTTITRRDLRPDGKFTVHLSRRFASFDSLEQAVDRYVKMITGAPRYAVAWAQYQRTHSLDELLIGIAHAGYATSPGYDLLLRELANGSTIAMAAQAERQKAINA